MPRHSQDWPHQEKRRRVATERDEFERAAWRVMVAATVEAQRLIFVDGCGTHTSLAPIYGYAPRGHRLYLSAPRSRGKNTTLHDAAFEHDHGRDGTVANGGRGDYRPGIRDLRREGALLPSLEPGQIVVMDNLLKPTGQNASGS